MSSKSMETAKKDRCAAVRFSGLLPQRSIMFPRKAIDYSLPEIASTTKADSKIGLGNGFSQISVMPSQSSFENLYLQGIAQPCSLGLASPRVCPFGGACHPCPARVQAKLKTSQPGDKYEQEADLVAETVMQMREPYAIEVSKAMAQTRLDVSSQSFNDGMMASIERPSIAYDVVHSLGQPLDEKTRSFMEPRFGYDFGHVRLHTDERSAKSVSVINAKAFTIGHHIVLGNEQNTLSTIDRRKLLAHELTHTIQQSNDGPAIQYNEVSTVTPIWKKCTIKDFCLPFASREEAREAHAYMVESFIPMIGYFGPEVAELWKSYLTRKHGASLKRRVFSDPSSRIVQGFVDSEITNDRQNVLLKKITSAVATSCPELSPNKSIQFPISKFLSKDDLEYPINFNNLMEIPGNIAGGVSESDAGLDRRIVSGSATFYRSTDVTGKTTGIHVRTNFYFVVQDALDFCPGGAGAKVEQGLTIPLSRLEMTGLFLQDEAFAYDMPYEVRYSGMPIEEDLDFATVKRCYPDAIQVSVPEETTSEEEISEIGEITEHPTARFERDWRETQ
jgi:hypothetical protein